MERFERLQKARSAAGFVNASEAARRFGWNENSYRSHENGQRGFTDTADRYAIAFDVRVEWLLYDRGPMREGESQTDEELTANIMRLDPLRKKMLEQFVRTLLAESQ
jgi:hypothetical protein